MRVGPARHFHAPVRPGGVVQDLGGLSGLRGRPQHRRGGRGVRLWRTFACRCDAAGLPSRHLAATHGRLRPHARDRSRPAGRGGATGRPGRSLPPRRKPARSSRDRLRERAGQYRHLRPRVRSSARDGRAGSAQPSEPADPGEHRLSFPGDGPDQGRCAGCTLLPRRSRLRRRCAVCLVGDGCRDGAAGQRLLVVEHSPAGPFRRSNGDREARSPAGCGAGTRASLGSATARRAVYGRGSPPGLTRKS